MDIKKTLPTFFWVSCLLFGIQELQAQHSLPHPPPLTFFFASANAVGLHTLKPAAKSPWPNGFAPIQLPGTLFYSPDQWPLFCRLEWQWEKHTKLPWKFRLGSLSYVNQLEGK